LIAALMNDSPATVPKSRILTMGVKKEVIETAARHRTNAGNLVQVVDARALAVGPAQGAD